MDFRAIANKIANGDWQRLPSKGQLGKMDFVQLEELIYAALLTASLSSSTDAEDSALAREAWNAAKAEAVRLGLHRMDDIEGYARQITNRQNAASGVSGYSNQFNSYNKG